MKILFINGDCIQVNSSANLCHLAYLQGLVDAGHEVTLLSASGKGYSLDSSMKIPEGIQQYTYYSVSQYEKLSLKKKQAKHTVLQLSEETNAVQHGNKRQKLIKDFKKAVLGLYGVHGINAKFVWKAKAFRSDEDYDFLLSVSTPPASHLLAYKLLRKKRIKCTYWIQIWEDPWYSDAYGFSRRDKVYAEEKRLLSFAEQVCYVSPITMENQKRLFPESSNKMFWQPLPAYYKSVYATNIVHEPLYGYFGAYNPVVRDLQPFYCAASQMNIELNICGDPSTLFLPTEKIHIYPRMTLEELRPFEEKTNVLVFLCNKNGGQIPGKIYQYATTDKTVLFILDGTEDEKNVIREYFEPYNRFVFCENNVEDIKNAIWRIENNELGDINNRPLNEFEPVKIVQRILEEGMNRANSNYR